MIHPDEGQIQAWLDGELEPGDPTGVEKHLATCEECRRRGDILRGHAATFSRAVLALDEQAGSLTDPGPIPVVAALTAPAPWRARSTGWSLARAAVLLLVAAGAAAALVPGSPLREWIVGADGSGEPPVAAPVDGPVGTSVTIPPSPAAIHVAPVGGRLRVSLRTSARDAYVHVRLTDADRATVRVDGEASSRRFVTGPGSVEVLGPGEGDIWVELPRSAVDAAVRVDGEPAVRVVDGQLVVLWPVADSLRGEVVLRVGD